MSERLDERLRRAARTYRRLGNHTAEGMFLEAADTICELRDDLQRANAENAKLREQIDAAHMSRLLTENENEKLRELVRDMAECMDNSQPRCKKCKFRELNCQWFKFDDRMRELGVEVDG